MDPQIIENPNNDPIVARIIENYLTTMKRKQILIKSEIENKGSNTVQNENSNAKCSYQTQ
mgnify:FL=1|jgi:hypothetical protein